jgi:hypothetical protein
MDLFETCKREAGISTFLRGCNKYRAGRYDQISPLTWGKNKTIFHKAENTFTFAACKPI